MIRPKVNRKEIILKKILERDKSSIFIRGNMNERDMRRIGQKACENICTDPAGFKPINDFQQRKTILSQNELINKYVEINKYNYLNNKPIKVNNYILSTKIKNSFIISYKNDCIDRENNLKNLLNYLSELLNDETEIVLVEQDINCKINWLKLIKKNNRINHVFIKNEGIFNKGWGYNIGVNESNGENLIFNDIDLYLKEEDYISNLKHLKKFDVVNAYETLYSLTDEESKLFILKNFDFNIVANKKQHTLGPISGGVFMMKKEKYLELNGFDEECFGWGYEDSVFDAKMEINNLLIYNSNNIAIHLYHDKDKKNNEYFLFEKRNYGIYQKYLNKKSQKNNLIFKKNKRNVINLSVFIANLNQLDLTKKCVEDLLNQTSKDFDIHLFDQNSDELGTNVFLNECENGGINVYRNTSNVPLNHLWNNFKNITKSEYLCFLNNDVELSKRFIEDNISVFEKESEVGIVIHITNHPDHLKTKESLEYTVLNPAYYQGWDFCIRREILPEIPSVLQIFGGDDYIFAKIVKNGYKIALIYSSPIIHYNSKTSKTIKNINETHINDALNCQKIFKEEQLEGYIRSITDAKICESEPKNNMKII